MITSNGIVIDGYARLEAARLQGRPTVECSNVTSSKKKRSAAFYFVIDHFRDCRPLVASLWHEGPQNRSKRRCFSISGPASPWSTDAIHGQIPPTEQLLTRPYL